MEKRGNEREVTIGFEIQNKSNKYFFAIQIFTAKIENFYYFYLNKMGLLI